MSDPRAAYRGNWTRFIRDVAEAARKPGEDASHLREAAFDAKTKWPVPLPSDRRDLQFVIAALPDQAKAYAAQKTNRGRIAIAEPLLAWAKTCAELLGVPLAEPRTPKED